MAMRRDRRDFAISRGCRECAPGFIAVTLGALALVAAGQAAAAEWDLEAGIRVSQSWTDNVGLDAENPEEEQVTEIAPRIRLEGEGRRARVSVGYRLQQLFHDRDSERDRTNHEFDGEGTVELVRERLFFDADATQSRASVSPEDAPTTSNLVGSNLRNDVTTWGAGPRLQHELGRYARIESSLRREHLDFGTETEDTNDSDEFALRLTNGPLFTTWGWAADYSRNEQERQREGQADEETVFEQVSGELNLRTSSATQLFIVGGSENNEFVSAEEGDAIDGDFWEIGIRWNPRRTISLEAAAGERFFGETARLSFNATGSALDLTLTYTEDLLTTPDLLLERSSRFLRDENGNIVLDPTGRPVRVDVEVPTVSDDVILQRRADMRIRWNRGYSSITLALQGTNREFQREATSEQARRADLDWRWTRLPRSTVVLGTGYRQQDFAQSDREDETWSLRGEFQREISTDTSLSLAFESLDLSSSAEAQGFDSNRITLALDHVF